MGELLLLHILKPHCKLLRINIYILVGSKNSNEQQFGIIFAIKMKFLQSNDKLLKERIGSHREI